MDPDYLQPLRVFRVVRVVPDKAYDVGVTHKADNMGVSRAGALELTTHDEQQSVDVVTAAYAPGTWASAVLVGENVDAATGD